MPCLLQGRSQGLVGQVAGGAGAGWVVVWPAGRLGRRSGSCWRRAVLVLMLALVLLLLVVVAVGQ